MLIRPPVVREMRHDLWVSMMGRPQRPAAQPEHEPVAQGDDPGRVLALLKELGELRATGVLTEDEFEREKARLLG